MASVGRGLIRNPELALAAADEGVLVYDLSTHKLHRLNGTAALVIELCDGRRTATRILNELGPFLEVDGRDACRRWIDFAVREGLVQAATDEPARPPSSEAFSSTATSLRREGLVLAAYVCQEQAVSLDPDDPELWASLGELAHIVGRRTRAREAYERYVAFEPDDAEVQQILIALCDAAPPPRAPDRVIQQLYSRFAGFYEDNMCGDLDYQAPKRLQEALDAHGDRSASLDVLELGCGTGLSGRSLRPWARRLMGVDLSPEMADQARATGLYDAVDVAEITAWLTTHEGARFDLIAACDTLIYFGDLRQVLLPAARLLVPGGQVILTVESGEKYPFALTDSGRFAHTAEHIREAARDAGLEVVSLSQGFLRNEYGSPVTGWVGVLCQART